MAAWEDTLPVKRNMLLTEKVVAMGASVLYSPILSPTWLYKDINRLEIHLRRDTIEKYGYAYDDRMSFIDYVMV